MTPTDSTSLSLLDAVRHGNTTAWERLVELYHPLVYDWCRRWGLSEHDAQNVGQEVFLAIYRGIGKFRKENPGDSFRAWVRTISRRKFVDWVRNAAESPQAVGGSSALRFVQGIPAEEEEETSISTDLQILYHRAIRMIECNYSTRDWDAFRLVVLEGQRPADAAQALSVDVNVVYLAKSRILARLKEEFADLIDGDLTTKAIQ